LYYASSKLKVGFGFNHGGFSGITIGQVYSARLPSASSIFSAEANAILLALSLLKRVNS
jgi:hypothetical protein